MKQWAENILWAGISLFGFALLGCSMVDRTFGVWVAVYFGALALAGIIFGGRSHE